MIELPKYIVNMQHRNAAMSSKKSQWLISTYQEGYIFSETFNKGWADKVALKGWGLHLVENVPSVLGKSHAPSFADVKIAKFVANSQGEWHGYPVAHWISPFDKPSEAIARVWLDLLYINKPTFAKLLRGKRCSL